MLDVHFKILRNWENKEKTRAPKKRKEWQPNYILDASLVTSLDTDEQPENALTIYPLWVFHQTFPISSYSRASYWTLEQIITLSTSYGLVPYFHPETAVFILQFSTYSDSLPTDGLIFKKFPLRNKK